MVIPPFLVGGLPYDLAHIGHAAGQIDTHAVAHANRAVSTIRMNRARRSSAGLPPDATVGVVNEATGTNATD